MCFFGFFHHKNCNCQPTTTYKESQMNNFTRELKEIAQNKGWKFNGKRV